MILEAKNLCKVFETARVKAVQDISFGIERGKTLGVAGESGSGKSTLAKLVLRLLPMDSGEIYFKGRLVSRAPETKLKDFRKKVQVIFQEPFLSLDPRMKVKDILREPFLVQGEPNTKALEEKVRTLLLRVELPESFSYKFPRQMSGGECQRVAIARAISRDPELVVCDEPVSSLDAIAQVQILNLLLKLQKEQNAAFLFISHDLKIVRHMSDDILVMKEGRLCEIGPRETVFQNPQHPYTRLLIQNLR